MLMLRTVVMFVFATIATVEGPVSSGAQPAPAASQADSVSIHISLEKNTYAIGEKPIGILAIKNISSNEIMCPNDLHHVRVHVTRKDTEPPKTELHRHLLGDFRSGDSNIGLRGGSVVARFIAPGSVDSLKFDLSAFYDISMPGDYSVYLEIYDPAGPKDGSVHWLRTNTVKFEIQAPAQ
jgi:hypothetical protein